MKKIINFTEGNILISMFLFSLPIVMGEVLQNLYSSVDSLVVGNFVGRNALAAVSVSETLVNLLVGFATILSQALSVCLAYRQIHKRSPAFRSDFAEAAGNRAIVAEVTRIGMPSGLQTSFISFSNIFVWRYINGFSATAMAGIGIAQ